MIGKLLTNRYWTAGVAGLLVLIAGALLQQLGGQPHLPLAGTLALVGVAIGVVAGVVGTSVAIHGYLRRRHHGNRRLDHLADRPPLGDDASHSA